MSAQKLLPRAMVTAIVTLLMLSGGAIAQTADETITVIVLPPANPCVPVGTMTITPGVSGDPIQVPSGGGASNNDEYSNFQVNVENASCSQWSVTAQLDDFQLSGDVSKTIPASTLILHQGNQGFPNPNTWEDQPLWLENLPADLATGTPTMPAQITFSGASPATGSSALATANTAAYGSPGNYSFYYWMSLANVPTTVASGSYTATITLSVQGND